MECLGMITRVWVWSVPTLPLVERPEGALGLVWVFIAFGWVLFGCSSRQWENTAFTRLPTRFQTV